MGRQILILCHKFPYPAKDGGAIATMGMIRGLHALGHTLTVMSMNTYKHYAYLDELPDDVRELATFYTVDVDIRIKPFDALSNLLFSKKSYHVQRFYSQAFDTALCNLLRKEHFELVQLEGLFLSAYIPSIRKIETHAPIVLRAHNVEHEIFERQAKLARGLRQYYLAVTAARIRAYQVAQLQRKAYDAIMPISDRDGAELKKLGASVPMHIAKAGVDLSHLPTGPDEAAHPSICYIGALDWAPNQEGLRWFIEKAWPGLRRLYPNIILRIAGRQMPAYFAKLKKPGITVVGETPDAYAFMRAHSIMIAPLFSGSGMRVKLIEGMALGRAIVTTSISAEGIPVQHGRHLLLADNAEDFVNCVATLIENPQLCKTLGEHAQALIAAQFDLSRISVGVSDFYESILSTFKPAS